MNIFETSNELFTCDYCKRELNYSTDHYETWGTGMMECKCCAKECKCHPQCNCSINNANCPECATTQYAEQHGGTPTLLICDCGSRGGQEQYGVQFTTHTVCIECTPMRVTVLSALTCKG